MQCTEITSSFNTKITFLFDFELSYTMLLQTYNLMFLVSKNNFFKIQNMLFVMNHCSATLLFAWLAQRTGYLQ